MIFNLVDLNHNNDNIMPVALALAAAAAAAAAASNGASVNVSTAVELLSTAITSSCDFRNIDTPFTATKASPATTPRPAAAPPATTRFIRCAPLVTCKTIPRGLLLVLTILIE